MYKPLLNLWKRNNASHTHNWHDFCLTWWLGMDQKYNAPTDSLYDITCPISFSGWRSSDFHLFSFLSHCTTQKRMLEIHQNIAINPACSLGHNYNEKKMSRKKKVGQIKCFTTLNISESLHHNSLNNFFHFILFLKLYKEKSKENHCHYHQ